MADYFGIRSALFDIADTVDDQVPHAYRRGMAQHTVSRTWRDAD